jgi:predicted Zn-dependent peptidase
VPPTTRRVPAKRALPASTRAARAPRAGSRTPSPSYQVERFTLPNGLRVVIAPDRTAPVVAVAVHYDVGFRSEPTNRTGFAHLFEHLMFQGSENVGKAEHPKYVQAAGGTFNGSTHPDYTNYFQLLPSGALELALFLEADRMRAPKLTQENLENQIAVVQEEIRVNVMNRPYGGFPWIRLPAVAYSTFPNAHNGYGAFEELQAATLADASSFFDAYYAPGNAVLTVAGDVTVAGATALIEKHWPRSRRLRRATGCLTPSPTSPPSCPTCCSLKCSRRATPAGWSSGWSRRIVSSRASRPISAPSVTRSISGIRCCSRSRRTTRRWVRPTTS